MTFILSWKSAIRTQTDNWSQLPNFSNLSNEAFDVTIEEQSTGHSDQNHHHRDPEQRQKDLSDWSLATGSFRGWGWGEKVRKQHIQYATNAQSPPPSTLRQKSIQSSFKHTKPRTDHCASSAVRRPGATRRHTHRRGEPKLLCQTLASLLNITPRKVSKVKQ